MRPEEASISAGWSAKRSACRKTNEVNGASGMVTSGKGLWKIIGVLLSASLVRRTSIREPACREIKFLIDTDIVGRQRSVAIVRSADFRRQLQDHLYVPTRSRPTYVVRQYRARPSDEPVHDGEAYRLGARVDVELGVDVLDVGLGSSGTDEERLSDFRIRAPGGQQAQHFMFSGGQSMLILLGWRHLFRCQMSNSKGLGDRIGKRKSLACPPGGLECCLAKCPTCRVENFGMRRRSRLAGSDRGAEAVLNTKEANRLFGHARMVGNEGEAAQAIGNADSVTLLPA